MNSGARNFKYFQAEVREHAYATFELYGIYAHTKDWSDSFSAHFADWLCEQKVGRWLFLTDEKLLSSSLEQACARRYKIEDSISNSGHQKGLETWLWFDYEELWIHEPRPIGRDLFLAEENIDYQIQAMRMAILDTDEDVLSSIAKLPNDHDVIEEASALVAQSGGCLISFGHDGVSVVIRYSSKSPPTAFLDSLSELDGLFEEWLAGRQVLWDERHPCMIVS